MTQVECITLNGQIKRVPSEDLIFRPAAYALMIDNQRILLLRMKATGKYHLPGGGMELGERMEETLRREVYEETGLLVQVERMVDFEELFFYYDPSGHAFHGLHFYFLCKPVSGNVIADDQVMDGSAEKPRWVAIDDLTADDFQHAGAKVLAVCQNALKSSK